MSEQQVFILAERALQNVVDQIADKQWSMTMPPDFLTAGNKSITLREVINSHAYDDAWVPDMLAGKTMDEVGRDKFTGDLLGDAPKASFAALVATACAAAATCDDLDRTVHCSFGDFPAREYFWQISSFRGLRAYDIARVLSINSTLPDDLVQGLWEELSPVADLWRSYGVFPAAIDVPATAPLQARLLGLTGRQP